MTDIARLSVRITPRGGRNAITAIRDGVLQARVAAPPVDGAANLALIKLIAEALSVSPGRVTLLKGHTSRIKTVQVDGIAQEVAVATFMALTGSNDAQAAQENRCRK